jgi:hypothetical protein
LNNPPRRPPDTTHNKSADDSNDFHPFQSRPQFEMAELLYVKDEMAAGTIDDLFRIITDWYNGQPPPADDHKEMYAMIDAINDGNVPWDSFTICYNETARNDDTPPWMTEDFEVWFRDPVTVLENMLADPELAKGMDYTPKRIFRDGKRQYRDLMSGNHVWEQAVR